MILRGNCRGLGQGVTNWPMGAHCRKATGLKNNGRHMCDLYKTNPAP